MSDPLSRPVRRLPARILTLTALVALAAGTSACRSGRAGRAVREPEVATNRDLLAATRTAGPDAVALVRLATDRPADLGLLLQACGHLLAAGRRDEALARIESAERLHGNSPLWFAMRARCLRDPQAGLAAAEAALQRDANCLPALEVLGELRAQAGDPAGAAACFARASWLDPFDARLFERQAIAWAHAGHYYRAELCYWACIGADLAPQAATPTRWWAGLAALREADPATAGEAAWFRCRAGGAQGLQGLPPNVGPALPPPPTAAVDLGIVLAGVEGTEVTAVVNGSTAAAAGVCVGDRLCAVGGEPVPAGCDGYALAQWLATVARPGRPVVFQVRRGGAMLDLTAAAVLAIDLLADFERRLAEASRLAARGSHAAAARLYGDCLTDGMGSALAFLEHVRETERAGSRRDAIAVLERHVARFPQRQVAFEELGRMLAVAGEWSRLAAMLEAARGRFPQSGALAALAGLLADHAGRTEDARGQFERSLRLADGGEVAAMLAYRLDVRDSELLAAERGRRKAEERRLAAEQRAAERKRRNDELLKFWLLQKGYGGLGGTGGSSGAGGYQYTGPGIAEQFSQQQMMNGMWAHNMGR